MKIFFEKHIVKIDKIWISLKKKWKINNHIKNNKHKFVVKIIKLIIKINLIMKFIYNDLLKFFIKNNI